MPLDINKIDIRSKLIVNCPDILKQAGLQQIDFGNLFLNANSESLLYQGTDIVNNTIDIVNNIDNIITPETIKAVKSSIEFIIKDLIDTTIGYCNKTAAHYLSPDFVTQIGLDVAKATARYTQMWIINPAEIIKEYNADLNKESQNNIDSSMKEKQKELVDKIKTKISETIEFIKPLMDEIQPYASEIQKCTIMGPDYVTTELERIYKKNLNKGISFIDEQLGKINTLIYEYVEYIGSVLGKKAAEIINNQQRKLIKKTLDLTNTTIIKLKIEAISLINKAILNLMALIGG